MPKTAGAASKIKINWKLGLYVALILLSFILLGVQFAISRDFSILTHDLLFAISVLPLQVGLTTLILDQLMERRERQERLEKMNMVIGVFFSEIGTDLLCKVSPHDDAVELVRARLAINDKWTEDDFLQALKMLADHQFKIKMGAVDLIEARGILSSHRSLLVQLLENPILLEHETFTNTLRAVFHMTEELQYRKSIDSLPASDIAHLNGDTARAYGLLIREWVSYMGYLKNNYPYLFSLAIRTNPFDLAASPIVAPAIVVQAITP